LKIRRRFASGGAIGRWLDSIRQRFFPTRQGDNGMGGTESTGLTGSTGYEDSGDADHPVRPVSQRLGVLVDRLSRRATALPVPDLFRDGRFVIWAWSVFLGTLVVGYLLAALVFFPAPIIASSQAIPRVIGLKETAAREQLQEARLRTGAVTRAAHPTASAGVVVWQDPPPGVVAPEATEITLTVSEGARRIPVPDVAGYEADQARMLIEASGLRVGQTRSTQAPTPRNVVVNTNPTAGATVPPGGSIELIVSVGAATIRVPSLKGLTVEEARLALETAGLALGTWFGQITGETVAPGEVFYQEPSAGTLAAPGSTVNVRVARSGQ
jgi:serine/threonine-protein kinase